MFYIIKSYCLFTLKRLKTNTWSIYTGFSNTIKSKIIKNSNFKIWVNIQRR